MVVEWSDVDEVGFDGGGGVSGSRRREKEVWRGGLDGRGWGGSGDGWCGFEFGTS
jgi:hypothetical protein